jgi:putative hemolysin
MELLIISLLIFLNGFFALSEIALVSSKKSRLEHLRNEGHKGAGTALRLLENSGSFLSAIQVGITLIGIITGVFGGLRIADEITPFFQKFDLLKNSAEEISLTITVLTITYFSIVIGELVPKTIALSNPEKIAVKIAPPIYWFSVIFYPVVKFLSSSTSLIVKLLGIRRQTSHITEGELRHMLKTASREGIISNGQDLIHEKVFYFADKKAKHLMTHRMEVEWIDLNKPESRQKEVVLNSKHSRIVCCRENLDNFQGILYVKDFLTACTLQKEPVISELIIQPLFVPESADAPKVLNLFKKGKIHFCVVVNEYGTLEGIITLHDILENLIGEFPEAGDSFEPDIFVRDDKSYLISGDAPVEILDGVFDNYITDLENTDYTTVAGFVLDHIDKVPQIGDKFTFNGYVIEIVDIDGNRIDKILVKEKNK